MPDGTKQQSLNATTTGPKQMTAAVYRDGQLNLRRDYPVPAVQPGQALVKVLEAGICATDLEIVKGYMDFQGVPGHEFVGRVVRTGNSGLADRRVVGQINCVCGRCDMCSSGLSSHCRERATLGISGLDGAFAEYLVLPEANLHVISDDLTDEQAVFVEPLSATFQIVKQVSIDKRWKIAVLGDGRLGLLACQVLALRNPSVTLIGKHPEKLLVADKKGIQIKLVDEVVARNDYDLVVDCTGSASGLKLAGRMIRPRGTIILKTTIARPYECDLSYVVINEIRLIGSRCGTFPEAIDALTNRQIDVSAMISKTLPLEQIDRAMRLADEPGIIKVLIRI